MCTTTWAGLRRCPHCNACCKSKKTPFTIIWKPPRIYPVMLGSFLAKFWNINSINWRFIKNVYYSNHWIARRPDSSVTKPLFSHLVLSIITYVVCYCHYILVVSVVRQLNKHNMAICSLLIGGTRYPKRAIITAMLWCDGWTKHYFMLTRMSWQHKYKYRSETLGLCDRLYRH